MRSCAYKWSGASLPPVNKATGSPSSDGQGSGMSQAAYAPDRADARGSGDPAFWVQPPVPRADSQPPAEHQVRCATHSLDVLEFAVCYLRTVM